MGKIGKKLHEFLFRYLEKHIVCMGIFFLGHVQIPAVNYQGFSGEKRIFFSLDYGSHTASEQIDNLQIIMPVSRNRSIPAGTYIKIHREIFSFFYEFMGWYGHRSLPCKKMPMV